MTRIDALVGDTVKAGETELTEIQPAEPAFLDVRSEAEQKAAVEAAKAAEKLASADVGKAQATLAFANEELARARGLIEDGTISKRTLDDAVRARKVAEASLESAKAALKVREHELAQARTRLLSRKDIDSKQKGCDCVPVKAPVSGVILQIFHKSEGVVAAGTPLIEIGNPENLELTVDLLSEDAVLVSPGQKAIITGWGGPDMEARVRRIEPFGYTKVSALGIEEQRVNVILDLVNPPESWHRLGHGYRVDVRVVLFDGNVLKLPLGALFRNGGGWSVFVVDDGHARLREVEVGERNNLEAEIKGGLKAGEKVVLYPGDRIQDGTAVAQR
nr:HlyD family efflux transporter periplasmic adaptor subunit [Kordiimonas marina]